MKLKQKYCNYWTVQAKQKISKQTPDEDISTNPLPKALKVDINNNGNIK